MAEDQADHEGMKEKILEESKTLLQTGVPQPPRRPRGVPHARKDRPQPDRRSRSRQAASSASSEKDIALTLTAEARDFLIEKGFDPAYGARPMRRAVERYLEDPLAEALLRGDVKPGDSVNVVKKPDAEELIFVSSRPEPRQEQEVGV